MRNIKFYFLLILALSVSSVDAQIPSLLNYQGFLADSGGNPVSDTSRNITFSIYTVSSGGSAIWTEMQNLTTAKGVFTVDLGAMTTLSLAFDVQYYLGISVDGGAELSPRVKLTSASYAFTAKNVENDAITAAKIASGNVVKSIAGVRQKPT